jgi:hypothetical protein
MKKSFYAVMFIILISCNENLKKSNNPSECIKIDTIVLYKYTGNMDDLALHRDRIAYHFNDELNDSTIYLKVLGKSYKLEKAKYDTFYYEYIIDDLTNYNLKLMSESNKSIITFTKGGELMLKNSKRLLCDNLTVKVFFVLDNKYVRNSDSIALEETIHFKPLPSQND